MHSPSAHETLIFVLLVENFVWQGLYFAYVSRFSNTSTVGWDTRFWCHFKRGCFNFRGSVPHRDHRRNSTVRNTNWNTCILSYSLPKAQGMSESLFLNDVLVCQYRSVCTSLCLASWVRLEMASKFPCRRHKADFTEVVPLPVLTFSVLCLWKTQQRGWTCQITSYVQPRGRARMNVWRLFPLLACCTTLRSFCHSVLKK